MPDWLTTVSGGAEIPIGTLIVRLVSAFAFGAAVAAVYAFTHKRDQTYQPSFATTLVLLAILIAVVTQVIGENVARAFSLVGALAIVRFRTVVADTRDTAFVIFAVVLGMAVGAGQFSVAGAGLAVGGAAAFLLRPRSRGGVEWRLTVRVGAGQSHAALEPVLARHFARRSLIGTSTARQGAALDLVFDVGLASDASAEAATAALNQVDGVQQVDLVRA